MATDISTLGIRIDIDEVKKAIKALDDLSKSAGKTEDSTDKVVASFARAARAIKNLEQANLAQEKTATQSAKTSAVNAAAQDAAANQAASRLRAQARLEEGLAAQKLITAKRLDLLNAKEAQASALAQKYAQQASAAQQRANSFALNQQSLVENRTLATQNRISQGAQRLALQQEKFEFQKAQAAERAARRSQSAWDNIKSGAQQFVGGAAAAIGFAGVAGSAVSILKTADSMTLLDSRLKLATKSQEDFLRTQQALRESSLRTGLGLEDQIAGFTQLERSTRAMGLSSQQLTFLTESFGKAAVVSGADTASYQSALTQLNQGFASGVIRGQEFNSVAEQAPAIMEALAAGLRGSNKEFDDLEKKGFLGVAALRKMAGEGKLVNSVTIPALLKGLQETNKQFDQMPLTVQRATEQLSSAYKIWISDQNAAYGATSTLAKAISGVANNINGLVETIVVGAELIAVVIGSRIVSSMVTASTATAALSVVTGVQQKQALALAVAEQAAAAAEVSKARVMTGGLVASNALTLSTARLAAANEALAVAQANATRGAIAASAAMSAGGAVMTALGGPLGVAVLLLGGLAVAWMNVGDGAKYAAEVSQKAANDIRLALVEGDRAKAVSIKDTSLSQVEKLTAEIQALKKQKDALLKSGNSLVGGNSRREGAVTGFEAAEAVDARIKALIVSRDAMLKGVQQQNAEILKFDKQQRDMASLTSVNVPTPQLDDKPKSVPLLAAKESEYARALANTEALKLELATTQMLGLEKGNVNEYTKRAIQLQAQLNALNPASKNYLEAKANLEKAIAQEKYNGTIRDEIDIIQKQNKAINDWRDEVEKLISKQEELSTYTSVDIVSKAGESYQEATARRTKEEYQRTLDILKEISRVRVSGQEAGVAPAEIEQSVARVLSARSTRQTNATFEDQLAIVNNEQFVAQANGEIERFTQLEELKTAIIEEQTRQRNNLRAQESQAIQNQISALSSGTDSILQILESSGAKQTGLYKSLFAVNKAFAIANSVIKIQQGIAEASALPFPANLGAMATVAAATSSIVSTIVGADAKFAKGGAFVGGDVVNTPTAFPMSGGRTGLMGEVPGSPEAIMPLTRDANGRLGVSVNGGGGSGGGVVQHNSIEVVIQGGQTNEQTASVVSEEILRTMKAVANNAIIQAKRPGGALT